MEKKKPQLSVDKMKIFMFILTFGIFGILFLYEPTFPYFTEFPASSPPFLRNDPNQRNVPKLQVQVEKHHVGYLKVHKTGSSTIQNIFNRFVLSRNLTEVLPSRGNYLSDYYERPIWRILPPSSNKTFDMLFHHCKFNDQVFKTLLPSDTVYIASVREPVSRFISAFCFYRSLFNHHKNYYLPKVNGSDSELIHGFLKNVNHYDKHILSETRNRMAGDFGYPKRYFSNLNLFDEFLNNLGQFFDFVIIAEHFKESIIYVRRILGWSIKDVLFFKINSLPNTETECKASLNSDEINVFKNYSPLDFKVYEFFLDKFKKTISHQSSDFFDEVKYYSELLTVVKKFCSSNTKTSLAISASKWSLEFIVTMSDCRYMSLEETDFLNLMKERRSQLWSVYGKNNNSPLERLKTLNMTLFSKFKL